MSAIIERVTAYPVSFAVPQAQQVSLGIGRTVKRDAVLVRVDTRAGISGWGEAHAARAPTAIAELVNTTLAQLVTGMDALENEFVWEKIYRMQLASHGAGAASVIGMSGIDLALWDIKGKSAGRPVYELLGGTAREIDAYAGGVTLGYQPPSDLVAEARALVGCGFCALKLRIGDSQEHDRARIEAVRDALGNDVEILVDGNTAMTLKDVEALAPILDDASIGWLEEPFPAHDYRSYQAAASVLDTPLAAGENHYTRFDFERVRDDGAITVWQPDMSKCGGLTEALRIAHMAAAAGIAIHPHTSLTSLNMSASLQLLSAIGNGGYFEADVTGYNPLRDDLCRPPLFGPRQSTFVVPPGVGLGIDIDESKLDRFGVIPGPGYV